MEKAGDGQICALPARLSYNNKFCEMLLLKGQSLQNHKTLQTNSHVISVYNRAFIKC